MGAYASLPQSSDQALRSSTVDLQQIDLRDYSYLVLFSELAFRNNLE